MSTKYVTVVFQVDDDVADDRFEEALELVLRHTSTSTLRNRDRAQEDLRVAIKGLQVVESTTVTE